MNTKRGVGMDYKRLIIAMVQQINNEKYLRKIYSFIKALIEE